MFGPGPGFLHAGLGGAAQLGAALVTGLFFLVIAGAVIVLFVLVVRFLWAATRAAEAYARSHESSEPARPVAPAAPADTAPADTSPTTPLPTTPLPKTPRSRKSPTDS